MPTAFDVLDHVPSTITAGEAVSWLENPSDYPTASYSISYKFAGQTPQDGFQQFSVDGVESVSGYTFTFAKTIKPGIYSYEQQVTRTSDAVMRVVARGQMVAVPNLATVPTVTAAAAMLAALETAITTLTTTVDQSVSFNGQSFTKANLETLLKERVRLQAEVYREQQRLLSLSGEANSGRVALRFEPQSGCGSWPSVNGLYNR